MANSKAVKSPKPLNFVKEDKNFVEYDSNWNETLTPCVEYSVKVSDFWKAKIYSIVLVNGQKHYQVDMDAVKKARKIHKEIEAHFGI